MSATRRWRWPLFVSGIILLSQAHPLPAPVRDAATLAWANGFQMHYPFWHQVFTPFCSLADYLTGLSLHQLEILTVYLLALAFGLAGLRRGLLIVAAYVMFVAWGTLIPRPLGRLVAADPNILLIDFHSHTSSSHDGRKYMLPFLPQRNEAWHAAQGFEAGFITDHNVVDASEIAHGDSLAHWRENGYRSLEGEEVSLIKTHLVILGNRNRIINTPYDSDLSKIPIFIADMHKQGIQVIASLPEYWLYHWGPGIQDFIHWGMDGFEIINSAPKALDFPIADRLQIVDLCRKQNLFMTGISDNHGYGYATDAWNAMRLPGWSAMDPDALQDAVLKQLRILGFGANEVLERAHFMPRNDWQLAYSPLGHLWYYWRSLQPVQAISWSIWVVLLSIAL